MSLGGQVSGYTRWLALTSRPARRDALGAEQKADGQVSPLASATNALLSLGMTLLVILT